MVDVMVAMVSEDADYTSEKWGKNVPLLKAALLAYIVSCERCMSELHDDILAHEVEIFGECLHNAKALAKELSHM